jgi:hypothetical protein
MLAQGFNACFIQFLQFNDTKLHSSSRKQVSQIEFTVLFSTPGDINHDYDGVLGA